MISVLLVSDDSVLGVGLEQILRNSGDLSFACTCGEPDATAEAIQASQPDVILVDITAVKGLSFIGRLRKCFPEARICIWARDLSDEAGYQAMMMGVHGILRRTLPVTAVVTCLRQMGTGQVWFEERHLARFFYHRVIPLTRRESELVSLVARGLKNKEIAQALILSEATVRVYLCKLFQKLGVKDRYELALYGLRNASADESRPEVSGPDVEAFRMSSLMVVKA